ncbi:MAG TPA: polysaccharide deacetylase family protein [Bacteroidales bacterium]|nr:polysaccharide deacetylase family protein [Bacteroidales bacterium]HRZ49566.1 polysaccharide deacetylase family protein [Bacteroidales bacterium]
MIQNDALLIGCPEGITSRMRYIFSTLLHEMMGVTFTLTDDMQLFSDTDTPKILYGVPTYRTAAIIPSGLLTENGTACQTPGIVYYNDYPVLFHTPEPYALLPFDVFSAAFWMLSRYEEYQPFEPDLHGRYPATASLCGRNNLLKLPVVDLWSEMLKEKLQAYFPDLTFEPRSFRFIPTIDADSAWAYRHKPWIQQAGAAAGELLTGRWKALMHRVSVHLHLQPDPFYTWGLVDELHKGYPFPTVFFLLGQYNAFNKNVYPKSPALQHLIREMNQKGPCGIHPSYETAFNPDIMLREIALLCNITGIPVERSRQHFLRFRLPETFRALTRFGITEDYSMGYASEPGFRAGTCQPFRFYDLTAEEETLLRLFPLTVMDGTLRDYLNLTPEQATETIRQLADTVKKYRGVFISLWHNESFSEKGRWIRWTNVYRELLRYANPN